MRKGGNVLGRAGRCPGPDVWEGEMSVRGNVQRGKCPFPDLYIGFVFTLVPPRAVDNAAGGTCQCLSVR